MRHRVLLVCIVLLSGVWGTPSVAHEARPLYVEVTEQDDGTFAVRWRVPPVVPEFNRPEVSLSDCEAPSPTRWFGGRAGAVGQRPFRCVEGLEGRSVEVTYRSYNPAVSTLVRIEWNTGQIHTVLASPEEDVIALPGRETTGGIARQYFVLGIEHILTGYDHLLFIACLVLISGTIGRVLLTITGFTIAHSVTLALAALGIVRVSVPAVEAAIALSIVFLAVEIARGRRYTLAWRFPVTVSASFGLLHGFGFASVLASIGLPQTEVPAALLFFNVGVEVGQVIFVVALAALFLLLRLLGVFSSDDQRGMIAPPRVNLPIAYGVGTLGSFWMITRIAGF